VTANLLIRLLFTAALVAAPALRVHAQGTHAPSLPANSPFAGGVPDAAPASGTLSLSVADVIRRALEHNLGVLTAGENVDRARGDRWIALSQLLPNVSGSVSESRQVRNLEAFGFPLRGAFPSIVGPFNVFDARVFVSQSVFDLGAINETRAQGHAVAASRHSLKSARDLVVLVAANLYLQTVSADARAGSARAQRDTAQALFDQATSLKQGGIIAGIDVVRAEVRLATERQRVTSAENEFQKSKLQLARVIGLPLGQEFSLSDQIPFVPVPQMSMEEALERAYRDRPDYLAAQERVRAAEAQRQAALGEMLPSVHLNADWGAIGLTPGTARSTFTVVGGVNIPIFQGGRHQGRLIQADAELRTRRNEAEDLRAEIYYDVRTAFLDLQATGEQLQVATRARDLAAQQLTQSRDRFAAGVASNIEVIQAQEAVTLASEQYIGALYAFNVSKAVLARSLGTAEEAVQRYLGGSQQ
jgi:outer membrane protein TolC